MSRQKRNPHGKNRRNHKLPVRLDVPPPTIEKPAIEPSNFTTIPFTEEIQYIVDPNTRIGFHCSVDRESEQIFFAGILFGSLITSFPSGGLSQEEKERSRTVISFKLPFRLSNFDIRYDWQDGHSLEFISTEHPPHVAAYNLGLPAVSPNVNYVTIDPDPWGITGATTATLACPSFLEAPPTEQVHEAIQYAANRINMFINYYSLVSNYFNINRISIKDVHHLNIYYVDRLTRFVIGSTSYYIPPPSKMRFARIPREATPLTLQEVKNHITHNAGYQNAYRLWVEAMRALERSDPVLASIYACTMLEILLYHYVESFLSADKSRSLTVLVKNKKSGETKRNYSHHSFVKKSEYITLDMLLNQMLVQTVPRNYLPLTAQDSCNKIKGMRNSAVHDPIGFNSLGIELYLMSARNLIDYLSFHHPN